MATISRIVREAVADIIERGFSQERIDLWMARMRAAIGESTKSPEQTERTVRVHLERVFESAYKQQPTAFAQRFTSERLRPEMRRQLEQRIAASASLIKLNREQKIDETLRRFQGWATSIPNGGSDVAKVREEATRIVKPLASLDYESRRVAIDQGHKFASNLNYVLATSNGAIAMRWHSRWRVPGYDYRPDHRERDGHIYLVRGNWAQEKGLVKPNDDGYYDQITAAAEEPFCRCTVKPVYSLRDLPSDMLTEKGKEAISKPRD